MSDKNSAPTAEPENSDAVEAEHLESSTEEKVAKPPRKSTKTPVSPAVDEAEPSSKPSETPVSPVVETTVVSAESPDAASAETGSQPRVVYVEAPLPPKSKGNRGFGVLLVVFAALVLAAILAVAFVGTGRVAMVGSAAFFIPVLAFVVASVLLVLLLNRASWWAHVLGSLFVGAFVYFGSIGGVLLINNVVLMTGAEAAARFNAGLVDPLIVASALLAREVALWTGLAISARGRAVKARNAEARATFDREAAERRAEYEAATAASAS